MKIMFLFMLCLLFTIGCFRYDYLTSRIIPDNQSFSFSNNTYSYNINNVFFRITLEPDFLYDDKETGLGVYNPKNAPLYVEITSGYNDLKINSYKIIVNGKAETFNNDKIIIEGKSAAHWYIDKYKDIDYKEGDEIELILNISIKEGEKIENKEISCKYKIVRNKGIGMVGW